MKAVNDYRRTPGPDPTDAPDESLRKITSVLTEMKDDGVAQTAPSYTDGSGAITAGGAAQQIFAANATRRYLFLSNPSDTVMYVNFGTAAVASQPSITLAANGGFLEPLVPSGQTVSILCATTGKAFVAKQA
jgi:hypothetical protein